MYFYYRMATAQDEMEAKHRKIFDDLQGMDMEEIKGMTFMPKSPEMWEDQYCYNRKSEMTTETIQSVIFDPYYGRKPQVDQIFVRKFVLGSATFHTAQYFYEYQCVCGVILYHIPIMAGRD